MPVRPFFNLQAEIALPERGRTLSCVSCGLHREVLSPRMKPYGEHRRGIMIVGEGPGETEDERGKPWQGKAGRLLQDALRDLGYDLARDCVSLNAVNCFPGGTGVRLPSSVRKAYRRHYSGKMIRVVTVAGRHLSGTPNHPVFTEFGQVRLGDIEPGDKVVCCSRSYWESLATNPDVEASPSKIEQLFDSLSQSGVPERFVGVSVDFHGDGIDGNVDVVASDRQLRHEGDTALVQEINKWKFRTTLLAEGLLPRDASGHPGACSVCGSLESLARCNAPLLRLIVAPTTLTRSLLDGVSLIPRGYSFRSGSQRDRVALEEYNHGTVLDAKFLGDLCGADAGFVALDGIGGVIGFPRVGCAEGLCLRSNCDAVFDEELFGGILTDSVQLFDGAEAKSRLVEFDYVDSVEEFHFDGPVYNFETEDGFYIAEGLVVSNCRPPKNRTPTGHEIACCRAKIVNPAIAEYSPRVILLMGGPAVSSVLGPLCAYALGEAIGKWRGLCVPVPELGAWVCPTYHPSYVMREEKRVEIDTVWRQDIRRALGMLDAPVPAPEDLRGMVRMPRTEVEVLRAIYEAHEAEYLSFDYETTGLRAVLHEVICASFATAPDRAVAFMMPKDGPIPGAWAKLLADPKVGKISHNLKFEDSWSRAHFGVERINWAWDSMLAAHVVDNRVGICGLDRQAFLNFGTRDWSDLISPYLSAVDGKDLASPNRIREFVEKYGEEELLAYNGIDSLAAFRLAMRQMEHINGGIAR